MFADDFESGDMSAWTLSVTDNGHLSVTSVATMSGSSELQTFVNDNNAMCVTERKPFDEARYIPRFHFDPNNISEADGNNHNLFYAYDRNAVGQATVELRFSVGEYQLRGGINNDSKSGA